jgi:hypothetical protein
VMRTATSLQSNLGGGTLTEEGDHLGTTEIDPQHRLAGLVDGVQGENGFGRIDAYTLNLTKSPSQQRLSFTSALLCVVSGGGIRWRCVCVRDAG